MSVTSSGPIKDLFRQIVSASNNWSSDGINRTDESYFRYGQNEYEAVVGTPPQLRVKPTTATTSRLQRQGSYGVTGSFLTITQDIEMTFWADNEGGCFNELSQFIAGYQSVCGASNTQGITQPLWFDNLELEWVQTADKEILGEMLKANFKLNLNLYEPTAYRQYVLVNTASLSLTQSLAFTGSLSGSSFILPFITSSG